jgi:hypothetical protein
MANNLLQEKETHWKGGSGTMLYEEPLKDGRSREGATKAPGLQQRHKAPRPKRTVMSGKQEDTSRGHQAGARTGDGKANIGVLH